MRRHVAVVDGVRHARERAVQEALVSGLVPFPRMAEHLRGLDEGKGPGLHRLAWVGSRNDLAGYSQDYPDVEVQRVVVPDDPAKAIVAAADERGASLIVAGSRGRGGFKGLLLGSTSQKILQHASCPVMIVRE